MSLNKISIIASVCAIFALSGCAPVQVAQGEPFDGFQKPKSGKAMVYAYRVAKDTGSAIVYPLSVDDGESNKTIGIITNGSFVNAEVPAGREIELWGTTEKTRSIILETQKDKIHCVRCSVEWGAWQGRPFFEEVDFETCQKEIISTRRQQF